DIEALRQLAIWAERYSPIVALEEGPRPESLLLDITGCAACFHGEDRLGQQALDELREQGWNARIVIAGTASAAWALAHFTPPHPQPLSPEGRGERAPFTFRARMTPRERETQAELLELPIAALRLPDEIAQTLAELGIERISQLAELPRPSI